MEFKREREKIKYLFMEVKGKTGGFREGTLLTHKCKFQKTINTF